MAYTQSHLIRPTYSDESKHQTGQSPSMQSLASARANFLHAATFRRNGHIFHGHGPIIDGDDRLTFDFYNYFLAFVPVTEPIDSSQVTRKIQIRIWCHPWYDSSTEVINVYLQGSGTAVYSESTTGLVSAWPFNYNQMNEPTKSLKLIDLVFDVQALESDSFVEDGIMHLPIVVEGALVHSVFAWTLPERSVSNESLYGIGAGNFQTGDPLRGYDDGLNGSVDSLVQHQINREDTAAYRDTFVNSSRRVLFQHGTATGYYCRNDSAAYVGFMDSSFRPYVVPRNLQNTTADIPVDIAFAYRSDAGTKIRFTAQVSGDSYEFTCGDVLTSDFSFHRELAALNVDPSGDTIVIDCYCSDTIAVEIKTIAIIETMTGVNF